MTDQFIRWKTPDTCSEIEVSHAEAERPGPLLLIWPGMGVDVRMYRFPVRRFAHMGYSVVLYNPRSHGNAGGSPSREGFSSDIEAYLNNAGLGAAPLTVIAHSAGCDGALRLSGKLLNIHKYFFISPILNPRESILFMYHENSINEFTVLLAPRSKNPGMVKEVLSDTRWLEYHYWDNNNFRTVLDHISGDFLIGSFLEEYFVESFDASTILADRNNQCEILLPRHDSWFSTERTREIAADHGCPCTTIETAGDHFFMRAWGDVWNYIEDSVRPGRSGAQ
jgi:pimeloyl-ACP methyl ester carboxylesterase